MQISSDYFRLSLIHGLTWFHLKKFLRIPDQSSRYQDGAASKTSSEAGEPMIAP